MFDEKSWSRDQAVNASPYSFCKCPRSGSGRAGHTGQLKFTAAMAAYEVAWLNFFPDRLIRFAHVEGVLATRMEVAPAWRRVQMRLAPVVQPGKSTPILLGNLSQRARVRIGLVKSDTVGDSRPP